MEHDLPDELINSTELGLTNGGDASQLHTSLGGAGGGQDAAAKHKQLSELLRAGLPPQQGCPTPNSTAAGASMGMMGAVNVPPGGPQGMGPQAQQQQQAGLMQQVGIVGGVAGLNRAAAMMGSQKGNTGPQQQQSLMGGQVMNGSPRMGYPGNAGMGSNGNLLAETLQQQGGQQMGPGGQVVMRSQQPGALNKVSAFYERRTSHYLFQFFLTIKHFSVSSLIYFNSASFMKDQNFFSLSQFCIKIQRTIQKGIIISQCYNSCHAYLGVAQCQIMPTY